MPWCYAVVRCRGVVPWCYAVVLCRGVMPWCYAVVWCRGVVPWGGAVVRCRGVAPSDLPAHLIPRSAEGSLLRNDAIGHRQFAHLQPLSGQSGDTVPQLELNLLCRLSWDRTSSVASAGIESPVPPQLGSNLLCRLSWNRISCAASAGIESPVPPQLEVITSQPALAGMHASNIISSHAASLHPANLMPRTLLTSRRVPAPC